MILRRMFASTMDAVGSAVIVTGGIGHTAGGRSSREFLSRDGWGRRG